jgi:hypothetical protein
LKPIKHIKQFFKLDVSRQFLLIEASIYSIWAFFLIRLFSFKKYIHWLKNPKQIKHKPKAITEVKKTIYLINKHAFWPTTCYTEAIACRLIFKRKKIKSSIYFGVKKDEKGKLLAHAWTIANNELVTGIGHIEQYTVVWTFED